MVEVQIIEDLQAPLHAGEGRLPDWLRTKKGLLALDRYAKSFVFSDALRFIKVRIVFVTQEKLASWPQAFSTRIEFEDRYTKGIFLLSKIISSRGLQDMKLTLKEPLL